MTTDITLFPFVDLTAQAQVRSGELTGPAVYATGGDPVDVGNDLKMSEVWYFAALHPTNGTVILSTEYDYVNNKLKWFVAAGTEVGNGTDLSTYTARFFCTGK